VPGAKDLVERFNSFFTKQELFDSKSKNHDLVGLKIKYKKQPLEFEKEN
jgi:hypothetical protein